MLKSGEDIISGVEELIYGTDENKNVVGYLFEKPCIVKVKGSSEKEENGKNTSKYDIVLYPWVPLTNDEKIPVPSDWVVTIVTPNPKLHEMYTNSVDIQKDD